MTSKNLLNSNNYILIGWKEWCQLPTLDLPWIKAKIDTGAKTSALHAFDIKSYKKKGVDFVKFSIHPLQKNNKLVKHCHAKIKDVRDVMSSNGEKEERIVIDSEVVLNGTGKSWQIELTLSNRDPLRYRMLLGREALQKDIVINPAKSYLTGKKITRKILEVYRKETK